MLTSRTHLNFSIFDKRSAALLETLIEILTRDDYTNTRSERLNLQTPVFDLGQHLLNRADFVDDVKVVSVVHNLMESTGKLLSGLDHSLDLDVGHFKGL